MEDENFKNLPHKVYWKAVNEIAKENNLNDVTKYKIECSAGSGKGDNYFGTMFQIQIISKEDNSIKLSLIAKLPPQNDAKREQFQASFAFKREILAYDVIFPLYKQFQEERAIDIEKDGFHEVSRCHKTLSDEPYEGIFFDDLKMKNFNMYDRFKDVTKEHVFLVMKAIAKMHATFFCLKDQKPKLVEEYCHMEDFIIFHLRNKKPLFSSFYECQKKEAFKVLETCENHDMKIKIGDYLNRNLLELFESTVGNKTGEPYATICHGDCWNNNMMFLNDDNGIPKDIRLIDFQILRYAPPVTDIIYYLFTSVTKELRKKYYQEFLDVYYTTLSNFIERLGSDPKKLFPREMFDEQLKKFGRYGLFMAVITLPAVTIDQDEALDIDAISEQLNDTSNNDKSAMELKGSAKYKERIKGIFEDMYELGYI
ncbi:hypothetical protein PVAND_000510 [Polypedilum vanderplanki]|uniref:CHK kinase-like domain-containing protein n=1 Tax=Polypedilum vanderplanki TaxID=319348 RepID=A0A9J6BK16_POLVA|nr:hypothetical protein PVAND_000510 [Polypedilum vanderplanki]